jgi:hypothetical protein
MQSNKPHIIAWVILLLSIALFSCNPAKRLATKIEKAKIVAYQNPKSFAEFCLVNYPNKYKLGKDSFIDRTIIVKGDSVPCPINQTKIVYVKCPDAKIIYKERIRIDTIENLAQIQSYINEIDLLKGMNANLTGQLEAATTLKDDAKSSSSKKTWWIVSMGILLLGSAYLNVRKLFF